MSNRLFRKGEASKLIQFVTEYWKSEHCANDIECDS